MRTIKQLLITIVALLCSLTVSAHNFEVGGIYYNITSSTDLTVSVTYRGSSSTEYSEEYSGAVTIPATVTYYGKTYRVTSIGNDAFFGCISLTSITIPESVMSIGDYAFRGCISLTSITIPESVTSIGDCAFYDCSSITSITLPEGVTQIGSYVFYGCASLTSIVVAEGNAVYDSRNHCNGIIKTDINQLVTGCSTTMIPESVVSIGDNAFAGCSGLTSITIPESVAEIGNYAFNDCASLKEVIIEDGSTMLSLGYNYHYGNDTGRGLFYDCPLEKVYLGRDLSFSSGYSYGYSPFYNSDRFPTFSFGIGLTRIPDYLFYNNTTLISTTIPEGVTEIGNSAFFGCSCLTSITIPEGVTNIGESTFRDCSSLSVITIPEGVTEIGDMAFSGCSSLTTINIPESVTSIGEDAFSGCSSLTNINIPEEITSIRTGTFKDCSSLTTITIPEGVTNIEDYAFGGCKFDCIAIYAPTLLEIGEHYAWPDQFRTKMLLVPYNLLDDYVNSDWNEYCWEINSFGYISNPSFEEEDTYDCNNGTGHGNLFAPEGWQVTYTNADWGWKNFQPVTDSNGQDGNRYFEFWAATYHTLDLSQKLYSLPAGTYILSAAMRTEKAEQVTNQHIYAKVGDKTYESVTLGAPIGSAWNAVDAWQTLSVEFTLDEASPVTIGATSTGGTESKGWFQIDNFRLSGASTNIALNQTAITINIEETATLTATMSSSSNVAPPTVTWTSSNTAVAIVDANGKVTAKGAGTATITAKAGEKSATCMVTVKTVFINNISLNPNSAVMSKNETLTLSATITPSNTTDKTVTWSSSNSAIASVDNNGKVTAKSAGAATITAKVGGKTATCEVNIKGWDFDYATGHLIVNDNYDYASSQDYPWSNVLGAVASVEFGPLATMIGSHALMNCTGLTTATIANSVTSIGIEAFKGCTGLTNINFPNQLTTIGANAFEKCTGLVNIALPNSLVTINRSAFKGCTGIVTVNFGEGVRIISDNSFENCTGLKSITIPNSVRTIQASIFANCDGLIRVTIPNSVTSIGSNAFADCDGLESITIPNSVTTIGTGAFNNCDGLLSIAIPYSVTNIGDNAFAGCDMLESVIIGDGVTIIGSSAFANCHAMSELTIGYSVTTIGTSAFSGCEALTSVIIPNSVTNIASAAFANCKGLNSATIGEQVKEIQNGAFEGCEKLKTVINLSKLIIEKGSTKHGYVAYYANVVMTEGLFLNLEELKLTVGENATLKATLVPEGSNTVRWSTSNSAVATVNEGKVTAKSAGIATIIATAGDKSAMCIVTVEKDGSTVSNITLSQNTATLTEGGTLTLTATVTPTNATDKTITWATTDAAIATIADGVVTAVASGTATITAQAGDKTATCVVTVEKKEQPQLTSGEYYLYNAATKQFLSRGEYWGTCATMDKYGI